MPKRSSILLSGCIFAFIISASPVQAQSSCEVLDSDIAGSYAGGCKDGLAHGKGTAKGKDAYEGDFVAGWQHGKGIYKWANGQRYEGEWRDGKRTGKGTYTWPKGCSDCKKRYSGSWENSKKKCGHVDYWDGDSYDGCFSDSEENLGDTKFQAEAKSRKYARVGRCQHLYNGRSVRINTLGGWGLVTGVVIGFSPERGVATIKSSSGDAREFSCTDIEE